MIQWVNNYYFSKMLRGNSASFFSILLCLAMIEIIASATTLCSDVQARCMGRVGCSSAMRAYLLGCDDLLHGDVDGCPARCRKALISLLSSEEQSVGEAFMTCDCQGDELCALQRRRLAVCTPDVLVAIGDVYNVATPIDCSLAELVCSADTSCLTALNFYRHHCKKLFQGLQCSSRCNNSLAILYQLDKARKLRNCVCEGTEDYNCPALMMHTERLCFSNSRNFNHHHHQNQQQQQQQQVQPQHRHQSANAVARPANPRKGSSSGMGSSDPHNKIAAQLPMADAATGGRQTTYNQQYQHQQQLQQQQQQQQYQQQQHHQQRLYQQQQRQPSQNSASLCVYPQPSSASIARCSRSTWWLVVILLNFFMFWTPYCYFNSLSITY